MKDSIAISVSDLTYEFEPSVPVLRRLSLEIHAGEWVVLAGPSGAGKTTLLTLVGALRHLQSGTIHVCGRDLQGLREKELSEVRKNIGFIFQDHHLFDALTANQTLQLTMTLFRDRYSDGDWETKPAELLRLLGLEQCLHSKPGKMSSGQRQRVAIARALINHPKLILADEPTAALDYDTATRVLEILRARAHSEQVPILMVTHDRRIIEMADRVVHLVDGRLQGHPPPEVTPP